MKFSALLLTSALCLTGSIAQATTGPLDLSSGSTGFSNTPVIGGFVDIYTFTLTSPSVANASITSAVNGLQDVDFSSITLTGPSGTFSFTQLLPDPFETWGLASTTLVAGSYTISLIGINGPGGGSYGGNFAVRPVPEPDALAMMLAGFGVVGFIARRRAIA